MSNTDPDNEKSVTMSVRMPKDLLLEFRNKCRVDLKKDPNDMTRQMMQAVIDGRLTMKLSTEERTYVA